MTECRAQVVSAQRIGCELEVRPEMLRVWKHELETRAGAAAADAFPGQGRLPSDPEEPRRLALAHHPQPDRAWVRDMTHTPTRSGWLYFAVLIDLATRGIVGWATRASLATALPLMALQQEANAAPVDFIEHWYNSERRHSTLQYVSPQQYEEQLRQMARAA